MFTVAAQVAVREGRRTGALALLVALLVPVPVLMVLNQAERWDIAPFTSRRWNVNLDGSWIEVFGYLQVMLAGLVLLGLAVRRREPVYAGWSFILAVVLADDALAVHETGGRWLAERVHLPSVPGLLEQDVGELLVWAALGVVAALVLWTTSRRSRALPRRDSACLLALVGCLVFFAVVVDMVHSAVEHVLALEKLSLLVGMAEAAGEVATMSGLLAFAVHVARRRPPRDAATGDGRSVGARTSVG